MFRTYRKFFYSPDGSSGGASGSEPSLEQIRQQLSEIQQKYDALQNRMTKGEVVVLDEWLKTATEKGEIFPKERYTGLQQTLQSEQEAHKKTKDTLTALQSSQVETTTKLSNLEKTVASLTTEKENFEVEVEGLQHKSKRAAIIFEKFPELAPFEAKGLLPDTEDTKLEEVFGKFSEQVSAIQTEAAKKFGEGGTPRTPSGKKETETDTSNLTAQAHLKNANEAMASGNQVEYDRHYDLYLAALQKEAAT